MNHLKFGEGQRNLVILPGLSIKSVLESKDLIIDAYQELTREFTIYLFDYQKDVTGIYTIEDMARDVHIQMEALALKHICLVGFSLGGMVAMKVASQYPNQIEQLILGSTSADVNDLRYQVIEQWIAYAKEKKVEELCLSFGKNVYPETFYNQIKDQLISLAQTVTEQECNRFIHYAESFRGFNCISDLEKIICPTLVTGDRQDQVFQGDASPQIAQYLTQSSHVECYVYDGYGHAVYDMAPDYKERILRFVCV